MKTDNFLVLSEDKKSAGGFAVSQSKTVPCCYYPLFSLQLRDFSGDTTVLDAFAAEDVNAVIDENGLTLVYSGIYDGITVRVHIGSDGDISTWRAEVLNDTESAVEFIDFPNIKLAEAVGAGQGSVLYPYNEGGLIEDGSKKTEFTAMEYPSCGNYSMFPNMVFAQFLAFIHPDGGLYFGLHDSDRGEKGIDFKCDEESTQFRFRLYTNGNFGENYIQDFDTVIAPVQGDWMDAADLYRSWFESNKPVGLRRVDENDDLPAWYTQSPVVITYPVRGQHDMDIMEPNGLYPYNNILPHLEKYRQFIDTSFMVLLMHWEGTAPWAPPYVWPPYGGEEAFTELRDRLHEQGDLFGVYCSGIGWTEQSNLIAEYNMEAEYKEKNLEKQMCAAPDGSVPHGNICTFQRSGYDICMAADGADQLMRNALSPLLESGIDYAQILDQNHGGGMYLCYGKDHNHPPMPGKWMTETMRKTLADWKSYGDVQLGCESSAAEPFMQYLTLSDNRFELNYYIGRPVPLYAYLYHEYLHNFSGNQVSCCFGQETASLCHRLAYSFVAGDLLTLVIDDTGHIMPFWGMRDFSVVPDTDTVLSFVGEMIAHRELMPAFCAGARMVKPMKYDCPSVRFDSVGLEFPTVLSSAFEAPNGITQVFVNYTDKPVSVRFAAKTGLTYTIRKTDGTVFETADSFTLKPYETVDITVKSV